MRIAVLGTGGIGGYFGGRLAMAGHDVTFLARGAHLAAIREHGLVVTSVAGDFTVEGARATDDLASIGEVEAVLLAVKTWQLPPVLEALPALVGPATAVVTAQNGVEAPDQAAAAVGRGAVLPGIAKIFAFIDGPGRVTHAGGPASLAFDEWAPTPGAPSERVTRLRDAVTASGAVSPVPEDIWAELWSKMLFVVPFGGLGAALDATIGDLRSKPSSRALLGDAMREVEALARARGIHLPAGVIAGTMAFVDDQPADATTSLQRDLLEGRPSELDAWTGAVVRLAGESGVDVPLHRLLLEVLTARHPAAVAPSRSVRPAHKEVG
ncbi:2-dehydropantoate 2-reductase [Terrabacter aerolatus]|uniref:2-dehydropantoate 2-reductase n=1 Tax=Terrabacter aerolatus TaxID=422442 RepID=A0A512D2H1_9MICO|nr:2-dehydropantoate 2-reductase [Terrabacter aerolatus]GEO30672.1 2-dehydropantoate 2-reductase [Terrabacter aerolatus]